MRRVWVPPRVMVRAAAPVKLRAPKSRAPVPPKVKLLLKLTVVPPATTTGAPEKLSRVAAPVRVSAPVPRALAWLMPRLPVEATVTSPVKAALSPPSWTKLAVPFRLRRAGPLRAPARTIDPLVELTLTTSPAAAPRVPAPDQVPAPPPRLVRVAPLLRANGAATERTPQVPRLAPEPTVAVTEATTSESSKPTVPAVTARLRFETRPRRLTWLEPTLVSV